MPNNRKFIILSIDDDPAVADLLERASATGFPEASIVSIQSIELLAVYLEKPDKQIPHLILLDLNIPDSQVGFDLLTQLRNSPDVSIIPIIILSALDSNLHINEAYFKGANAYMTKPESYGAWIRFMELLKTFWHHTATLPRP